MNGVNDNFAGGLPHFEIVYFAEGKFRNQIVERDSGRIPENAKIFPDLEVFSRGIAVDGRNCIGIKREKSLPPVPKYLLTSGLS